MTVTLTLLCTFFQPPELSLDQVYELYKPAYLRSLERYNHLRIIERKTWKLDDTTILRDGAVCGEYVKGFVERVSGVQTQTQTCVTRDLMFTVRKPKNKSEWALTAYHRLKTNDTKTSNTNYDHQRRMSSGALPDAFLLPFSHNQKGRWMDLLERMRKGDPRVILDKIEAIGSPQQRGYRVTYSYCDENKKVVETAFLELAPDLSWLVTKGGWWFAGAQAGNEWTIEYGEKLDGVPILKKSVFYQVIKDPQTGKTIADPNSKPTIVEVTSFEPYDHVEEKDYDPSTYGVELPEYWDPDRSAEVPLELYVAGGGLVFIIIGVLLIHFSRRRSKKPGTLSTYLETT